MMTIFTPSFADEADSNAQNLTVKEVVSRLPSDRFRVVMCCEGKPDPRIAARENTRLIHFGRHGNTVRALWQCFQETPDVYFFPREGPLDAAFLYLRRKLHLKSALVSYIVSGGLEQAPRPALDRNMREADAVFGNCRHLSQFLATKLGIDVGTIYDGIDRRYFFTNSAVRESDGPLCVLFAGSFRRYKRPDVVIRQAARWPNVQFLLAGQGEEESACRALVAELGCGNVDFLGHLTAEQLGDAMRRCHIFFFPSVIEGHPQVLGQAAACGLPAVCMKSYRPDYVLDGQTGFLAENDQELEDKLDLLIRNTDLRHFMSHAAITHAANFDWEHVAGQWQSAFELALARRSN
jgi:glycosyltransferase involved in cell wall biosynthesis